MFHQLNSEKEFKLIDAHFNFLFERYFIMPDERFSTATYWHQCLVKWLSGKVFEIVCWGL